MWGGRVENVGIKGKNEKKRKGWEGSAGVGDRRVTIE